MVKENLSSETEFIAVECDFARPDVTNVSDDSSNEGMEDTPAGLQIVVESDTNEFDMSVANECEVATTEYNIVELEDTEQNLRGFSRYEFKIEDFANLTSVSSPTFTCRNLPFCLLVIRREPNGSKLSVYLKRGRPTLFNTPDDCLSVEECESPATRNLEVIVSVAISLVDHQNQIYHKNAFQNHLYREKSDWGFENFVTVEQIFQHHNGSVNDLTFIVEMRAEPPYCSGFNSKEVTGHVGIKNQGATCYMNSLLEVLFFLKKFRTSCFRIPTEMDDDSSMALALQKVFYKLQTSNLPVSTTDLTDSFGWSKVDAYMQHDVQELMRILIDRIERRMKNTLLQDVVSNMFQGTFISYVKCRDVDFTSQREEIFYDIQLSLENANNVYDAFRQYVSPEVMDDDNKYDAGEFGLQSAEKGTLFIKLPPVLFLHLLRFQFDGTTNTAVKNNSFFEFPYNLDLTEYVRQDETIPQNYTLFAVLAHSGSGSHGHYVAYMNPSLDCQWFKFDDDVISLCHSYDAIDCSFGTDGNEEWNIQRGNAYMLVYIRDSDASDILDPVDPKYISDELILNIKTNEMNDPIFDRHDLDECDVYVFLEAFLELDIHFCSAKYPLPLSLLPKFRISKDESAHDIKRLFMNAFKISKDNQLRIWPICHSPNRKSFPCSISETESFLTSGTIEHVFTIWAEIALPGCELPPFNPNTDVLIFYYFYCASQSRTFYIDHGYHDISSTVADLVPTLNQLMSWPDLQLNIYEECSGSHLRKLIMTDKLMIGLFPRCKTFVMHIIFEPIEHDESTPFHCASLYYEHVASCISFTLINYDVKDNEISFFMSNKTTYPEFVDKLAEKVDYDREKIQIFKCREDNKGDAILSTSTDTLATIFGNGNPLKLLYFRLLSVRTIDIETKFMLKYLWLSIDVRKASKRSVYVSNADTVADILADAKHIYGSDSEYGSGKYRLLHVTGNILKTLDEDIAIATYAASSGRGHFRIEEIPKGDDLIGENEKLVTVYHFNSLNIYEHCGYPFIFKINLVESWECVTNKLRLRLQIEEAAWEDYVPTVIQEVNNDSEIQVAETNCIKDFDPEYKFDIGIDYKNLKKNTEFTRIKLPEKPIQINNFQ